MYNDIDMAKKEKTRQRRSPSRKTKKIGVLKAGAASHSKWVPGMEKLYKPIKKPVTLRLDADVVAWFQTGGRGYQTRMNRALRQLMLKEQKAGR